jgi:hypothetical protein
MPGSTHILDYAIVKSDRTGRIRYLMNVVADFNQVLLKKERTEVRDYFVNAILCLELAKVWSLRNLKNGIA